MHFTKYRRDYQIGKLTNRKYRGNSVQTGVSAQLKAYARGYHIKQYREILTPLYDRFPPQACDLDIDSFNGLVPNKLYKTPTIHKIM